ncbi:hypothetical protein AMTRI_Chr07g24800 [Amborella trichopoda]
MTIFFSRVCPFVFFSYVHREANDVNILFTLMFIVKPTTIFFSHVFPSLMFIVKLMPVSFSNVYREAIDVNIIFTLIFIVKPMTVSFSHVYGEANYCFHVSICDVNCLVLSC